MLRFAVACDANGATQSQRRCYLGALVVQLHAHDAEQAAGCLRDCTAVPAFHGSDECLAAVDLLDVRTHTSGLTLTRPTYNLVILILRDRYGSMPPLKASGLWLLETCPYHFRS
jgi:hypothetical protein